MTDTRSWLAQYVSGWVKRIAANAWLVVLICTLSTLGCGYYAANNLGVNTDTADMIAPHLDWRVRYRDYKASFPSLRDNLAIVIDAQSVDDVQLAARQLKAALIADESGIFDWIYTPEDDLFFRRNGFLFLSVDELERHADQLIVAQPMLGFIADQPDVERLFELLAELRGGKRDADGIALAPFVRAVAGSIEKATADELELLPWRELMAVDPIEKSDRRRVLVVRANLDYSSLFPADDAMDRVRLVARQLGFEQQGVRVRITGGTAMAHEELKTVSSGMGVAGLSALILVSLVLLFGLRSWRLAVAVLITLITGLVWTAAFAAFAVGDLNLISVAFAVLYIGLGVDYAIHFCLRHRELMQDGLAPDVALTQASGDVGVSLVLCALTTGLGFLTFVPTDFDGVSELGIISAAGMFISLTASLTMLPALIKLTGPKGPRAGRAWHDDTSRLRLPRNLSRKSALTVCGLAAVAASLTLPSARFDHNPINLRDPGTESVSTYLELMRDSDSPPWSLSVLVEESLVEPMQRKLNRVPEVKETMSLLSLVPANQDQKLAIVEDLGLVLGPTLVIEPGTVQHASVTRLLEGLQKYAQAVLEPQQSNTLLWQPLDTAMAALQQRLEQDADEDVANTLHRALLGHLEGQMADLNVALDAVAIRVADVPDRIRNRWVTADGRWRINVLPVADLSDNMLLARYVAATQAVAPTATGTPEVNLGASRVVVSAFQQAMIGALVIVAVLLLLLTRRVGDTAMVLLPLLLAGLLTSAVMVLFSIPFNFANVICLPLLLGIGVDNGVHMVHRARTAPPENGKLLETSTARGITLSALTTICGFGNLAYSSHPGTASMGQVLSIGLILSVVCTLLLLPALLADKRPDGGAHA